MILSDSIKDLLLERRHEQNPLDSLTDREMDVLRQIATGLSNKQIAAQTVYSEETVKVHIRNLYVNSCALSCSRKLYSFLNKIINSLQKMRKVKKPSALFY